MATQKHVFTVEMTCEGCSGAVTRVLNKQEQGGKVEKFDVDLEKQRVEVVSALPQEELLAIIQKTGKATKYVGVEN